MKFFILLSFLAHFFTILGQDSIVVVIRVIDKKTGEPIPNINATISLNNAKSFFQSGYQKAKFILKIPQKTDIQASFTHPIYETGKLNFTALLRSNEDTLFKEINLVSSRMQYVNQVVVKPIGTPYTVYESTRLSVADFEISPNGKLILLTYPKRLKKGSELLLYEENGKVLNSFEVPGEAQELVRDYRGNAHIVCKDNVLAIMTNENSFEVAQLDKDYFAKYVMPIIDTNRSKMYFSNFSSNYPAFDYFAYDQYDSTYTKIKNVIDKLMMEMYLSEFKFVDQRTKLWAHQKQLDTGIPKEVWIGATYFTQSIYYRELYAPLFHRNDSVFVFDYYSDQLLTYDYLGNPLDSVSMYHHYQPKATGWKKEVIQDPITGQLYGRFEKDGICFLGLIDTKSGEIVERIKLRYKYVDKIYVYDNFVYYIYRPFESPQKKFLYKEQLPYKFEKSGVLGFGKSE